MRTKSEILELVQKYEYGYLPPKPDKVSAEILSKETDNFMAGKADYETIKLNIEVNGKVVSFPFWFVYHRNEKKVKTIICLNFRSNMPDRAVPVEEIIDMGWNIATVNYNDITIDQNIKDENFLALVPEENDSSAGKIAVWAWGAMRILDYLLTRPEVDSKNVGIVGASRLGKTALVTGAFDERFAFVHSSVSGRCGANLFSYHGGNIEDIDIIVELSGRWFCKNFYQFVGREDEVPFDQDELVSTIAPRVVSISSAKEDVPACPDGEFACLKRASRAWEKYGFPKTNFPEHATTDVNYQSGRTSYYMRKGNHYFSREDWNRLLLFFDKNLNK